MKYLVIENQGEIEPNAFALMGASTKRDSADKIGMFGTGNKYSLAVLLENGIHPEIMAGDTHIKFDTQDTSLKGEAFKQVVMIQGRKRTPLSFTTSMGLHWGVSQALRELVSNSIDEGDLAISVRKGAVSKDGVTRVLIPYTNAVADFHQHISDWFLFGRAPIQEVSHWTGRARIYRRTNPEGCRIYRRGVLAFHDPKLKAAFDYDLDALEIREDRTAERWAATSKLANVLNLMSIELQREVIQLVQQEGEDCIEGATRLEYANASSDNWKELMTGLHVSTAALVNAHRGELGSNSRIKVLPESWANAMVAAGVSNAADLLTTAALKGYTERSPAECELAQAAMFDRCLGLLERAGVYDPANAPVFAVFATEQVDAPWGEYVQREDKVLVNQAVFAKGTRQLFETILEELMHRRTGYGDNTRQFQSAIFQELTSVFCRLTGEIL